MTFIMLGAQDFRAGRLFIHARRTGRIGLNGVNIS